MHFHQDTPLEIIAHIDVVTQLESPGPPCHVNNLTCGACCWGRDVSTRRLETALIGNRRRYDRLVGRRQNPSAARLLCCDILARKCIDLLLGPLFTLPAIGPLLRKLFSRRCVCAFVAFQSNSDRSIGCLIHPSRHGGVDVRASTAFRLLSGVQCGSGKFVCAAAKRLPELLRECSSEVPSLSPTPNWLSYSTRVRAACKAQGEPLCP